MLISGSEIKIGTQLAERDGYLWDVVKVINNTKEFITVRMCSDFSSFKSHWTKEKDGTPGGLIKTFRKSKKYYGSNTNWQN